MLIIDYSVVRRSRKNSLWGKDPIVKETELEEIEYRMAMQVAQAVVASGEDTVVLAMDHRANGERAYWRGPVLTEWYQKNTAQFWSDAEEKYYLRFDNYYHECELGEDAQLIGLIGKPLTQNQRPTDLICLQGKERFTIEEMTPHLPQYKGHRTVSEWDMAMCEEEYNKAMEEMPHRLAKALVGFNGVKKAVVVDVDGAEADDIAGVLVHTADKPVTLASIDIDWQFLQSDTVQFYDINLHTFKEKPDMNLFEKKVLGGDAKDNIKGTWREGYSKRLGPTGKATMEYILGKKDIGELNQNAIARNRQLLTLDLENIPKPIQVGVLEQVKGGYSEDTVDYAREFQIPPVKLKNLTATLFDKVL
jgi:hypothetical protein